MLNPLLNLENVGLPLVVTDVGREAAIEADDAGLQLSLTEIALGDGLWQPDGTATALQNEIKRLDNLGGSDVAADMLHLTVTDDTTDEYQLGEFGLYTDTGILFAIYSQTTYISEKIAESILMVSADMKLDTVPPGSVTIEGNNFQYPPATPDSLGVIKDAPNDGLPYVRQSLDWAPLVAFMPGMVLMWAGLEDQIPEGWQLCNGEGTTSNDIAVPDFRNRMIICAGSDYDIGDIGGAESADTDSQGNHSHSVTVNSHTLTTSQAPRHYHNSAQRIAEGYADTSDNIYGDEPAEGYPSHSKTCGSSSGSYPARRPNTSNTGSSESHSHSASSASTGIHTHTVSTLPPYYALAYIIKL